VGIVRSGEITSAERSPGDEANSCGVAEAVHLSLFFAVEEVVLMVKLVWEIHEVFG
jgi:hypothetical protein